MALTEFKQNLFDIVGGEAANEQLLGLNSGSIDSVQKSGGALARSFDQARRTDKEKAEKSAGDFLFVNMLDDLNGQIDWLSGEIANQERGFEEEHGEDWREQFAERVLDPDEIPERRDGESMADYRERIEQALIEKIVDENGKIRPGYEDDPDLNELAVWAKRQHDLQQAQRDRAYIDEPGIGDEERQQRREEIAGSAEFQSREKLRGQELDAEQRTEADAAYDSEITTESEEVAADVADSAFFASGPA